MDALLDEFEDWEGIYEDSEFDAFRNDKASADDANEDSGSDSDEGDHTERATPLEQQQQAPPSPARSSSEAGDMTCAICLGDIPLENIAMVKGCDHIYCAKCILHWTLHKEHPSCPQCKQPFSYLLTYRTLDGELSDFPVEESVVLLKRARWFVASIADWEDSRALLEDSCLADDTAWHDYADEYDLAEDEAIEAFYFSSAAGRARVTLGNRRFGEGGFIAGGRRQARPVPTPPRRGKGGAGGSKKASRAAGAVNARDDAGASGSANKSGSGGEAGPSAGAGSSSGCRSGGGGFAGPSLSSSSVCVSASVAICTPNAGGGRNNQRAGMSSSLLGSSPNLSWELSGSASGMLGSSPGGGAMIFGSSPSGSGRRARRNARRAAAVAGDDA